MKVLLLGGTGVFGARLARMLVADGHDVCVAGRSLDRAQDLATTLGCRAIRLDRTGPLDALASHDVVIDAAGPFQTYGDDPYRLARAAIAARIHYLDLADDAAFCAGIAVLDDDARAAGVCVASGVSSVPALSSAVVRALAGEAVPRVIDTAILPGNRAPRGLSVMQSILSQAGRPMAVWQGHRWVTRTGWSDPASYTLPGAITRQGWRISVPDQRLFPGHFEAETVIFRAGLELAAMRYGLAAFAALRRVMPFPVTLPVVKSFRTVAGLLSPFGTGQGGMVVTVTTDQARSIWRLLAKDGDGPFIPGVPARALLRRNHLPPGAGPALEIVTLAEAEAAMADLRVVTERTSAPTPFLFPDILGPAFDSLPAPIRATHRTVGTSYWDGHCDVRRGSDPWARLLCALFRFPPAGTDVPVAVTKTVTRKGETWLRRFGRHAFRSHLSAKGGGLRERFGPFTFTIGLAVRDGALQYPVTAGRLGPVPLPRWLLPTSVASETVVDDTFRFDVTLLAPVTRGLMVRYSGWLRPAPPDDPRQPPDT